MESLVDIVGYHQEIYLYRDYQKELKNRHAHLFQLAKWEDINDGDEVLVVGCGRRHYGVYHGDWNVDLFEKDWAEDDEMIHNRPYITMGDVCYLYNAMSVIKNLDKDFYVELLEHFGVGSHWASRGNYLSKIEDYMEKYPQHFLNLQCIWVCL